MSKRHPEDVKEVVVWRRFSELKKLHGELAYTHKNLFRRQEEFPPFPRAHVFGIKIVRCNKCKHARQVPRSPTVAFVAVVCRVVAL